MDQYNAPGKEPLRQPLSHRISTLSDISDAPGPYDAPYDAPTRPPLNARESLISIDSQQDVPAQEPGHVYDAGSSWGDSFSYTGSSGYAPVAVAGGQPARALSKSSRKNSYGSAYTPTAPEPPKAIRRSSYGAAYSSSVPEPINEEEYDLSLLRSAAPMGAAPHYATIPEEEPIVDFERMASTIPDTQDEESMRRLQEQEAQGKLTGGLGQGFRPDSRVRDADLLSTPTTPVQRNISRSFSRRKSSKRIGRAETIRNKGQDEANRRGEVIEVILEEPAGADLSTMEGPSTLMPDELRRSTFPAKEQKTQIFYPQPNWRPFSMRWPYLLMLIAMSVGLAVVQEYLYRRYRKTPLLQFKSPDDVDPGFYFTIKFAPTLAAVIYGVLWQFLDFEIRRLEAYYQLSKEGGALAAESINVDYVTSFSFFRPFRALKLGHYAAALSSTATLLAISLVPTFAAASIVLSPNRDQRMKDPDGNKELHFAAIWSRLLTSTLALCAVAGMGLFYILQSRRSGLLSDVRGIAGLASMAVVSHILMDFKDMDTAKHKDIHHKLKHRRYMLRNSSLAPDDEHSVSNQDRDKYEDDHLSQNPHPLMLRAAGFIPFFIGLWLFTGFIPVFLFTPADIVTDKAPWVITALAVCLKLCWNAMETAVRMMEPYYILSRRHAPSKTLSLDYTALPFGYMPIRALLNGHFLVFVVGFGSVMAEFLTILVTGLATVDGQDFLLDFKGKKKGKGDPLDKNRLIDSGQETVLSFYVSFGLSVFILLYMSTVAAIVFFRRRHPFLPRQPNTIASVLAFIHQSKMLYDFVGTSKLGSAEMMKRLGDGKMYGLGWFEGRDGQTHCGVDQEELISNYKHGINFLDGNQPWNTQWDVL